MPPAKHEATHAHDHAESPISVWAHLHWLAIADRKTLLAHGLAIPSADHLRSRVNRVTVILSIVMIAGTSWLGNGQWDGPIAIAVGVVYLSNGYNRHQFGLGNAVPILILALFPLVVGLSSLLNAGLPVSGTLSATAIVLIHVIAMVIASRFKSRAQSGNEHPT